MNKGVVPDAIMQYIVMYYMTVTDLVADFPFTVAVITAVPRLTARTVPFESTRTTFELLLDQDKFDVAERAGLNITDVFDMVPTCIKSDAGAKVILIIAGITVIIVDDVIEPQVAVIVTVPRASPVTIAFCDV